MMRRGMTITQAMTTAALTRMLGWIRPMPAIGWA